MLPGGVARQGISGRIQIYILGQHHGQIFGGHGNHAAIVAMDHRYGAAPIPLPGYTPVSQPIIDFTGTDPGFL